MLVWISDLGMKKGFRKSTETLSVELRGFPPYVGLPPFFRCVVTLGTNSGTLRGFFLASFQRCRTYTKGRILSIYQENARRPQERRALSVANNR